MLHGVKWTTASNIIDQVLTAAVTLVLAALLTPAEFGIVALAYIYITFIDMIVGLGFNTALIQRKELQKIHLDSVFWFNLGVGAMITGVAILGSGLWARSNQTSALQNIIIVLSALIPIRGLAFVQTAFLQKKMDFKSLAIRNNTATVMGGITGVILAAMGFGAWALVWQHLVREMSSMFLLWCLSDWRPGWNFRWTAIRNLWSYAWKVLTGSLGVFAQNQTDSLLIGLLLGPAALGLYRFADRLVEMILQFLPRAVQLVSLSHFAGLQQDLPELNRSFLFGSHLNSMVTFPLMAFLGGASPLILEAVGMQWRDATMVLRILVLMGIAKAMILLVGPLLQALSRPGIHSLNTWTLAVCNALAVCGIVWLFSNLAVKQQISLFAAMRTMVFLVIFTPLLLWQARRASGLSLMALLKTIGPAIVISLIIGGSQALLIQCGMWAFIPNRYLTLFMSGILASLMWLACLRMLDPLGWQYISKMVRMGSGWLGSILCANR
jgi:PST family polysaccharide transporter